MWKLVPGWPYEVSNIGEVRRVSTGHVLKPMMTGGKCKQYATVRFSTKPRVDRKVHHLVLEAFVGPKLPGMIALHRNDNTLDNRASNLYWGTSKDNAHDDARNNPGILSLVQVREIQRRRALGERGRWLAAEFSVSEQYICDLHKGRCYIGRLP